MLKVKYEYIFKVKRPIAIKIKARWTGLLYSRCASIMFFKYLLKRNVMSFFIAKNMKMQ